MKHHPFPKKETFIAHAREYNLIPVCRTILADSDTPVSLLRKSFTSKAPLFLLESAEGGEKFGRFSFLGISAKYIVKVFKETLTISDNGSEQSIAHHGAPFTILKDFTKGFKPAPIPEIAGFYCGMVGYMSYEMVSFIEKIDNTVPADEALALFMVPDAMLVFDNVKNTVTLVATTFLDGQSNPEALYDAALARLDNILATIQADLPKSGRGPVTDQGTGLLPLEDKKEFMQKVAHLKKHIEDGDTIQTVLSQVFTAPLFFDPVSLYRAQRYINPSPYLFYFQCGDLVITGSSPETMVKMAKNEAILRPIAGTRPRGMTEQQDRQLADDLLRDEKEQAEHLMLVDLGRNDLGKIAKTGSVQVTDLMFVEKYSHVMHLVSNIICTVREGFDAWDVFAACFPAGTLSGAPKVRAMELIARYEESPRGPYGGAVGYIDFNGAMDFAITIRTAIIRNNQVEVRAGAGIVADSDPETEHTETINKAKSLEKALQLLERGVI